MPDRRGHPESEVGAGEGYREVDLRTSRGPVRCRLYPAPGATRRGAILVGGVGGGWDTPGRGRLYPELARELAGEGIATLRVRYRNPVDLGEATFDVLAGLAFLEREGVERAALVGHSFGGAVVIQAAVRAPLVRTIVPLSTQVYGADVVGELAPGVSVLLAHGTADSVLPPWCSQYVHELAHAPKRLVLLDRAEHGLDEAAEAVHALVRDWIVEQLAEDEPAPR